MRDIFKLWKSVAGPYSAVNTGIVQEPPKPDLDPATIKRRRKNRRFIALIFLSAISLCTGLFIMLVKPYDAIYKLKNIFCDGCEIFELWRLPQVDLYLRVYLFNVTNADRFMSGEDRIMKVEQVGPYVYKERMEHSEIKFNDNGTLSTVPLHPLEWQAEMSYPRTEEDQLVMPNVAYLAIGNVAAQKSFWVRMGLNALLTSSEPLVPMTAKEFMFGYKTSLVTLGNNFLPNWIKFDKIGVIDRMYDFDNAFETFYTGAGDDETALSRSGLVESWMGSRNLPQWGDTPCANVHLSSDGSKFPANLRNNSEFLFYRKSLCRAATMVKIDEGDIDGFEGYKYTFKKNILDNGHTNPENKCFCREGKCLPAGLIDVTDCYYGFPIALSYPHFLESDEVLLERLEGVKPDEEIHRSSLWTQPDSGLPLRINIKFQINLALGGVETIHGLKPFTNFTVPLLWFEFKMYSLPQSMANRFKLYLSILPTGEEILKWIALVIAGPLFLWALLIKCRMSRHHPKSEKRTPIVWDDNSQYAKSLRRMSRDIEKAKLQSVYIPCELPLPENSDSPLMNSADDKSSSDSETDTALNVTTERRPSLIKEQTDKLINFGNKISENFKNLTHRLSNEALKDKLANILQDSQSDSYQSSGEEENGHAGPRRYSMPGDILGNTNYHMVNSSDDEGCEVEVLDDGEEFAPPPEEIFRRQSMQSADSIAMMNRLKSLDSQKRDGDGPRRSSIDKMTY